MIRCRRRLPIFYFVSIGVAITPCNPLIYFCSRFGLNSSRAVTPLSESLQCMTFRDVVISSVIRLTGESLTEGTGLRCFLVGEFQSGEEFTARVKEHWEQTISQRVEGKNNKSSGLRISDRSLRTLGKADYIYLGVLSRAIPRTLRLEER
jgi:hypothetical protein